MIRTLSWEISEDSAGMTIQEFLRMKGCSHHIFTHLRRGEGSILLNGEKAYTSMRLTTNDTITIECVESEGSVGIHPVPLPLDIIYEDEDLMVINKPSDMPIHPSMNNYENTLANAVMYYFSSRNIPYVYRCINRLDRDTSGLLILAKNMFSGAVLSEMSKNREIHREYLAIVEGILPEAGTIDAPIARETDSVITRCVDFDRGERAVTHFRRLRYIDCNSQVPGSDVNGLSLASVHLETGRTHQIRVHMGYIGHKLVGDYLYYPESRNLIGRQALHSCRLRFRHPVTGEEMEFYQDMPEDMTRLI